MKTGVDVHVDVVVHVDAECWSSSSLVEILTTKAKTNNAFVRPLLQSRSSRCSRSSRSRSRSSTRRTFRHPPLWEEPKVKERPPHTKTSDTRRACNNNKKRNRAVTSKKSEHLVDDDDDGDVQFLCTAVPLLMTIECEWCTTTTTTTTNNNDDVIDQQNPIVSPRQG